MKVGKITKQQFVFWGGGMNWDGLELESYALKYIEKGMKGILSYANSFLIFIFFLFILFNSSIFNLYMHNYILHSWACRYILVFFNY